MLPNLAEVLEAAPETKCLELGAGALDRTPLVFDRFFHGLSALVIADRTTFNVAGQAVMAQLRRVAAGVDTLVFNEPGFHAEHKFVDAVEAKLKEMRNAVPVAVGSGTINDLTKLAAHRSGCRYLTVATAASMDGYTAFGASITQQGSKQTFGCAAPLAVIADLDIIGQAPPKLTAAGYADLLAKVTAGADWLVAEALGVEPIHPIAWQLVQGDLHQAVQAPASIRMAEPCAMQRLMEGLLLSGFAMQVAASSRPASGAEHQFSHLWDMQRHLHAGAVPLHGFKVAIGTMAMTKLYDYILKQPLEELDEEKCCQGWPTWAQVTETVRSLFKDSQLAEVALRETGAKYIEAADLRGQLLQLRQAWPDLRERLRRQLVPPAEMERMLSAAGAPAQPEQISVSQQQLRQSFRQAYFIRRRFTILDLAVRAGLLEQGLDHILPRKRSQGPDE